MFAITFLALWLMVEGHWGKALVLIIGVGSMLHG